MNAFEYINLSSFSKKSQEEQENFISKKLVDLRELVGIYIFQCNQLLLKTKTEQDIYENMFNVLGLHVINQSNLFIKFFDDIYFYDKDYKISQQIICDLQNFMNAIYVNKTAFSTTNTQCYSENKYILYINPSINKKRIYLESCMFRNIYPLHKKESLMKEDINLILDFIKEMSMLYNGEKIIIELRCELDDLDYINQSEKEDLEDLVLDIKIKLKEKLDIK